MEEYISREVAKQEFNLNFGSVSHYAELKAELDYQLRFCMSFFNSQKGEN